MMRDAKLIYRLVVFSATT